MLLKIDTALLMITENSMLDHDGVDNSSLAKKAGPTFYWQHYALMCDPFPAIPDHSKHFPLPEWEKHLDSIQHLVKSENVLLALLGEEGMGKSTLSEQIKCFFQDVFTIHVFQADSLFSTRKLVRELEAGFNLKAPQNEAPEEQLDTQIADVQHQPKTCLLIIDDAHFLPLETLNSLLFLLKQQSKHQMRLHIILLGDKNLNAKLSNLAKHEASADLIHTIQLQPLSLDETEQYIEFRLNQAGLKGPMPLSKMQIEKIYTHSQGIPDRINYCAQQWMLDNLNKQIRQVNTSVFKKHQTKIIGAVLLGATLFAASFVLEKQGEESIQIAQHKPQAQQPAIVFENNQQASKQVKPQSSHNLTQTIKPSKLPSLANTVKLLKRQPLAMPKVKHKIAKKAQPQPKPKPKPITMAAIQNAPLFKKDALFQEDVFKEPKPTTLSKTKLSKEKSSSKQLTKKDAEKTLHLSKQEKSILKENSHFYTLQVIGLSHEKSMQKFIEKNHLKGKAFYIKTHLHGKPWFILVYGLYKTELAANSAIKNLPTVLQQYKPWPRQLKYVKTDIERG